MKSITLSLFLIGNLGSIAFAQLQHPEALNDYGKLSSSKIEKYVNYKESFEIEDITTGEIHRAEITSQKPYFIEYDEDDHPSNLLVLEENSRNTEVVDEFCHIGAAYYRNFEGNGNKDLVKILEDGEQVTGFTHKNDMAGLIAYNPQTKTLHIDFRGTETGGDWGVNLRPYGWMHGDFSSYGKASLEKLGLEGSAHYGILHRYMESREQIFEILKAKNYDVKEVKIGGHSLGGGLAVIAAGDLKKNFFKDKDVSLTTIGAVRSVNNQAAQKIEESLKDVNRYWGAKDIVPAVLPGILGFKHVGQSNELPPEASYVKILENHSGNTYKKMAADSNIYAVNDKHVGVIDTLKNVANKTVNQILSAGSSVLSKLKFW